MTIRFDEPCPNKPFTIHPVKSRKSNMKWIVQYRPLAVNLPVGEKPKPWKKYEVTADSVIGAVSLACKDKGLDANVTDFCPIQKNGSELRRAAPRCSTIWRLRFVMPTATATVWLTVDGPTPLSEHLAAFNMGYCVSMDLACNKGTPNVKVEAPK